MCWSISTFWCRISVQTALITGNPRVARALFKLSGLFLHFVAVRAEEIPSTIDITLKESMQTRNIPALLLFSLRQRESPVKKNYTRQRNKTLQKGIKFITQVSDKIDFECGNVYQKNPPKGTINTNKRNTKKEVQQVEINLLLLQWMEEFQSWIW